MDFIQKDNSEIRYSLAQIEALAGLESTFVTEILETFKIETPNYLNQIREGLLSNDFKAIHRAAHQLKPTMDIFAIVGAMELAREMEKSAMQPNPNKLKIEHDFKQIKEIIAAVIQDLEIRYKKN
jgi:HPt (histidine-containing phosphotransfer) domain-containing protein